MSTTSIIDIVNRFFVTDNYFLTIDKLSIFKDLKQSLVTSSLTYSTSAAIEENFRLLITNYWERIQTTGLGLAQIDDLIIFIILARLILLAIRYNTITAFIITGISIIAGYLWYSSFVSLLFLYEHGLYKNSLTFRLGVDATQLRRIMQAKVQSSNYQIRLTNPVGIMAYAIGNGSIYEGHRIDPLSMVISKIPERFFRQNIEGYYYLFYRKIIPITIRSILDFIDIFTAYAVYAFITRVNKKYCPYLIRWHWTLLLIFKFIEPFIIYLNYRINDYSYRVVYPRILETQKLNILLPQENYEITLLRIISFTIISFHLGFVLFGMFHALCGQYFYVPLFVENVELHIGPRDKHNIYSGGNTPWQDSDQKRPIGFISKIWSLVFIRLYSFIKKIVKQIRNR